MPSSVPTLAVLLGVCTFLAVAVLWPVASGAVALAVAPVLWFKGLKGDLTADPSDR